MKIIFDKRSLGSHKIRGREGYVMEFKMIPRHAKIALKGCQNMRIQTLWQHNLIQNNAKKYSIVQIICVASLEKSDAAIFI